MKRAFRHLAIIFFTLLFVNLVLVPPLEMFLIYFPTREMLFTPRQAGLEYEDIYLKTADGISINGWYVGNHATKKAILYFHGNGDNLSRSVGVFSLLYHLPASVFAIDYHGFGRSGGTPSEKNLYFDARAAYDYLVKVKKYRPENIVVMGNSLGGALALELAANYPVGGVVLQRTFTSMFDEARRKNPLYRWPIVWLRSKYDNLSKIGDVNAPVFIVHSREDRVIPHQMAVTLYERARKPKKLLLLEKGGHSELILDRDYIDNLRWILSQPAN